MLNTWRKSYLLSPSLFSLLSGLQDCIEDNDLQIFSSLVWSALLPGLGLLHGSLRQSSMAFLSFTMAIYNSDLDIVPEVH